jgi:hypothetical protein
MYGFRSHQSLVILPVYNKYSGYRNKHADSTSPLWSPVPGSRPNNYELSNCAGFQLSIVLVLLEQHKSLEADIRSETAC